MMLKEFNSWFSKSFLLSSGLISRVLSCISHTLTTLSCFLFHYTPKKGIMFKVHLKWKTLILTHLDEILDHAVMYWKINARKWPQKTDFFVFLAQNPISFSSGITLWNIIIIIIHKTISTNSVLASSCQSIFGFSGAITVEPLMRPQLSATSNST